MTNGTNDIIDPEEVFLGDDNTPVEGEKFLGGDPASNPAPPANPDPEPPAPDKDPPAPDNPNPDPDKPEGLKPEDYSNPAEYALKWLGYESDEVDFGDGNVVKLNELTSEQQADVLANQLERVVETYEAELQRVREEGPELSQPLAKQVFEFLKKNGDPVELAKYILENNPTALATTLSPEDMVRRHLGETMNLEGDELEAEVNFLKENGRLDTYAERAKKYLEGKGVDLNGLTQEQQNKLNQQAQAELEEFEVQKTDVLNYVSAAKEVAGIPVKKEINDFIASQILPTDPSQPSPFLQQLDNPAKLHRLAFLDNYFEDIVENLKTTYFEMGKSSVTPASEVLKKEPIPVRSFRSSSNSNRSPAVGADGKVDLDRLVKTDIEI